MSTTCCDQELEQEPGLAAPELTISDPNPTRLNRELSDHTEPRRHGCTRLQSICGGRYGIGANDAHLVHLNDLGEALEGPRPEGVERQARPRAGEASHEVRRQHLA